MENYKQKDENSTRYWPQVTYHVDDLRVYILGNNATLGCNIVEHLMQGLGLYLLASKLRAGIVKIKENGTLMKFSDEQLWASIHGDLCAKPVNMSSIFQGSAEKPHTPKAR